MYTLPDRADEMHIQSSASEVTLDRGKADKAAVTFTWDAATSPVADYESITYAFRLYATEMGSSCTTEYYDLGETREISLTHEQLNTIVSRWVTAGTQVSISAEVLAYVNNEVKYVKPESSIVEFTAVGYEKYPANLYMRITANDGTTSVTRLSQRNLGTGIYEASLTMQPCKYHFTTSSDKDYPAYGLSEGELMEYVNDGTIKEFTFSDSGKRTVVVDVNNEYNDCRVFNIIDLPTPGTIRMCGNGSSIGWDPGSAEGLFTVEDARHPYLYSWTGNFNEGGEIKINTGMGWGDQFFYAPENGADPATDHRLFNYRYESDGGDCKWVIRTSGKFKFTLSLNADDMWTSFEPAD